ncbi:MAG: hypothetical protein K2N54_03090 [Helicobacter sp.]|nr:hypothetical protein [Helicobacter sp.]
MRLKSHLQKYTESSTIPMSLRASVTSVAINEQRIPSEHSKTVDCFAHTRNDR